MSILESWSARLIEEKASSSERALSSALSSMYSSLTVDCCAWGFGLAGLQIHVVSWDAGRLGQRRQYQHRPRRLFLGSTHWPVMGALPLVSTMVCPPTASYDSGMLVRPSSLSKSSQ